MQSLRSLRPSDHSCEGWASSAPLALSEEGDHAEALHICESNSQLGLKSFSDVCDGGENRGNSGSMSHQESQQESIEAKCGVEEAELPSARDARYTKTTKSGRRPAVSRSRTRGDRDAARVGDHSIPTAQLIPAQLMSHNLPAQQYVVHNETDQCDFIAFINEVRCSSLSASPPARAVVARTICRNDAMRAKIFSISRPHPRYICSEIKPLRT